MHPEPVSVILPTLNEYGNLRPLVEKITKIINPKEIIIVDDNSSDGTKSEAEKLSLKYSQVKTIINLPPLGLTLSIQKGINISSSPYLVWMDVDFSHPAEILKIMMEKIPSADIVTGSWLVEDGKDQRNEKLTKIMSFLVNKLCQFLFMRNITAYTSGFILIKRKLLANFHLKGDHGEYFIDLLVRKSADGCKIIEVPFICRSRKKGLSKTAPNLSVYIIRGLKYLNMIFSLRGFMFK